MTQDNDDFDLYRKLLMLMVYSKRNMYEALEKHDMTPVQGTLLLLFEPDEGKSMHSMSRLMGCDASNITGLVDRLESQNLIERTVDPNDRRVKLIKLTKKGEHCRLEVLASLKKSEAADLQRLTPTEKSTLVRIIDKLTKDLA